MDLSEKNKKIYSNRFNEGYYSVFRDRLNKTISMINGEKGKLLDIGCGDGYFTSLIKENSFLEVYGADILEKYSKKLKENGINFRRIDLNREVLPFKNSFFDFVVAEEVIEHVFDNERMLEEINRVLKPNGTFICSVPNIGAWYNRILLLFGYVPHFIESGSEKSYGTPYGLIDGHVKAFTKKAFLELLKAHKFEVQTIQGCVINPQSAAENTRFQRWGTKIIYHAERFFAKFPGLSTNILVKAKKK
ncbi:MAG: class I SAM-dependent methyltransferase [archaeon]